jgi:hypothetical protein
MTNNVPQNCASSDPERALAMTNGVLRVAEEMLRFYGSGPVADLVRDRAEENMKIIRPWLTR